MSYRSGTVPRDGISRSIARLDNHSNTQKMGQGGATENTLWNGETFQAVQNTGRHYWSSFHCLTCPHTQPLQRHDHRFWIRELLPELLWRVRSLGVSTRYDWINGLPRNSLQKGIQSLGWWRHVGPWISSWFLHDCLRHPVGLIASFLTPNRFTYSNYALNSIRRVYGHA